MSDQFDNLLFPELDLRAEITALEAALEKAQTAQRRLTLGLEKAVRLADEGWAYVTPWVRAKWKFKERLEVLDLLLKEYR